MDARDYVPLLMCTIHNEENIQDSPPFCFRALIKLLVKTSFLSVSGYDLDKRDQYVELIMFGLHSHFRSFLKKVDYAVLYE